MSLKNKVQLIAYPNRIGGDIADLYDFMHKNLDEAIYGLHLLPFYPSNADSGFSPLTHKQVDPEYGDWDVIQKISKKYDLCVDLVMNHISDESPEFQDFLKNGKESKYANMFVDVTKFGKFDDEDLKLIHIRKEKDPFLKVKLKNGKEAIVWNTFSQSQIDLDYDYEITYEYIRNSMEFLIKKGVKLFRLDAFGYMTKKKGTTCFLIEPDVYNRLKWFRDIAQSNGADVLPEVHSHHSHQDVISRNGMYSYAFALPPLVLYTFHYKDSKYLKNWLRSYEDKRITVLDTHDGICIPDAEDIIPSDKLQGLIESLTEHTGKNIFKKNAGHKHTVGAIYQLTATFYSAMKEEDKAYLAARALQLFVPGIPQVYYEGMLAGVNDHELSEKTDEYRDINRRFYTLNEAREALQKPLVKKILNLMKFRNTYPAFDGEFVLHYSDDKSLIIGWTKDEYSTILTIDLVTREMQITYTDENSKTCNYDFENGYNISDVQK